MLHMYVSYGLCRRPTSGKHPALCGSIRDSCVWTLEPASDQCVWCPGDVSSKAVSVQSHSKPGTRQPCPYVLGGHVGCSGDLMGDFCPKDADLLYLCPSLRSLRPSVGGEALFPLWPFDAHWPCTRRNQLCVSDCASDQRGDECGSTRKGSALGC